MKTQSLILLTVLIGCFLSSCEQPVSAPQLQRIPYESSATNLERSFFLYLPEGYEQSAEGLPVMLFLHGNGERGNGKDELDYVITHGPLYEAWIQKRDLPFIIIAPQLPMFGMDTVADYIANRTPEQIPQRLATGTPPRPKKWQMDFPMTGAPSDSNLYVAARGLPWGWPETEDDLNAILDHVLTNYKADKNRVYLTGLSYGGFGSWYMASTYPERFAAVAPVVGWGHPDLMPAIAENQIPVWAFAGGRDPVVQPQFFYPGINALEKHGLEELRFTTHEDMGHDAWTRVYGGQDLYDWFLQFQK